MYAVYVLADPKHRVPRYVGLTRSALEKRLAEHLSTAGGSAWVRPWARRIRRRPVIWPIAMCRTVQDARAVERIAIAQLVSDGVVLLNRHKNPATASSLPVRHTSWIRGVQWGHPRGLTGCKVCRRAMLDTLRAIG